MNLDPQQVFGPSGALSKKLSYFEHRPSQIDYAQAVRSALADKQIVLLEAQTGTGKTLAYLIPALESGKRILISTGTKALQEQLFFKDLPLLHEKLGLQFNYLLMKGRRNYLCLLRYERVQEQPFLPDEESVGHFEEIQEWVTQTETGDIAESGVPDHADLWKHLTVSADSCLGAKCRFYNQCFIFKLKQKAEQSQILVVNHHLFFADLSLQILNDVSIFPSYDIVIFDEAHQLADIATHNLSIGFSEHSFGDLQQELMRELQILRVREKKDVGAAQDRARKLQESMDNLFLKFAALPQKLRYDARSMIRIVETHGHVIDRMFLALLEELLKYVEQTEDMPQIYRRLAMAQSSLAFLLNATDEAYVYWAERNDIRQWTLQASPLDVSSLLAKSLWSHLHSAVLTSATLFVDNNSTRIREDLGIEHCVEKSFPYNFDYASQACLYVPKHLPDPTDPRFASSAAEEIVKLVEVSEGGAFVLCTSYSNLRMYENALKRLDYPLLVQGSKPKQLLMKNFLKKRGSVLLATMSFWQGIDVQGDTLISVIIDKLPFAVPNDPLVEAKIQYLRKQQKNPFLDYQLPTAVMMLKQGLGRLIRTAVDYGILAVLDRRLLTKNYGQVFLRNLPQMPVFHKLEGLASAFDDLRSKYSQYHRSM